MIICALSYSFDACAQNARTHNFIFRVDLGSSNVYTAALSSTISGLLNSSTSSDIFGTSYLWSFIDIENDQGRKFNVIDYKFNGLTAKDLFYDIQPGFEIGYQTYKPGIINAGFFASVHYRVNQFKLEGLYSDIETEHSIQRTLFGVTGFITFGRMRNPWRVSIEGGAKYSLCLNYNDPFDYGKDAINNGLISHFAIKFAGKTLFQDIGIFADINHFNMFDSSVFNSNESSLKMNMWTFGLTWKVNWKQSEYIHHF